MSEPDGRLEDNFLFDSVTVGNILEELAEPASFVSYVQTLVNKLCTFKKRMKEMYSTLRYVTGNNIANETNYICLSSDMTAREFSDQQTVMQFIETSYGNRSLLTKAPVASETEWILKSIARLVILEGEMIMMLYHLKQACVSENTKQVCRLLDELKKIIQHNVTLMEAKRSFYNIKDIASLRTWIHTDSEKIYTASISVCLSAINQYIRSIVTICRITDKLV